MPKRTLNRDAPAVQANRHDRKQIPGEEAVQERKHLTLDVDPLHRLVFDCRVEDSDYQTGSEQRPAEVLEEFQNRLNPREIEQFCSHIAHHREEVRYSVEHLFIYPLEKDVEYTADYPAEEVYSIGRIERTGSKIVLKAQSFGIMRLK